MTAVITIGASAILGLAPNLLVLIPMIIVSLLVYSSLGAMLCLMVKEVFEAQTLLNLPRFLMIFLSGVVFPFTAMPLPLQFAGRLMPLAYTVEGIWHAFRAGPGSVLVDAIILIAFLMLFVLAGLKFLSKKFE
jgi:ABC-2 type transport system permease protein